MPVARYVSFAAIAGLAVAGFVAAALAADVIEERQDVMKSNGDAMKALSAIAKNEAPFDAAVVQESGETIAAGLTKAKDLFPEGSGEGDTRAKPEIWQDKADFNRHREETITAAQALAAVTEQANFMPALANLGNGCKGCHDKYQRPKD
ncbi:MAG TPA: cytochrome c [Aestuariivirgaceae bacterium]|nr:cytochrome c [Aestuariivirgaceae bacterium]